MEDYEYFEWLCGLVDTDMSRYSELMKELYETDFIWCNELDRSRSVEGLALRSEYYKVNPDADWLIFLDKPCSVLEALIPIASRMNDIIENDNSGNLTRVLFWNLIENLGLKRYSNIRLLYDEGDSDRFDIQMKLSSWLNREFEPNGKGSIFPLEHPRHDQRYRTIVYQMYDYMSEKYLDEID